MIRGKGAEVKPIAKECHWSEIALFSDAKLVVLAASNRLTPQWEVVNVFSDLHALKASYV